MAVGVSSVRICALRNLPAVLLAVWALMPVVAGAVSDTALPDPTRPPEGLLMLSANGGALISAEPQLQSVIVGTGGRLAVIGGQTFKLGDRIGDARLVRIAENEVVLAGIGGRRTLKLFVPVKTPVAERPAIPARRGSSRNP